MSQTNKNIVKGATEYLLQGDGDAGANIQLVPFIFAIDFPADIASPAIAGARIAVPGLSLTSAACP